MSVPTGKQKVLAMRDDLRMQVEVRTRSLDRLCANLINAATKIKREAYFNSRGGQAAHMPNLQHIAEQHGQIVSSVALLGAELGSIAAYVEAVESITELLQEGASSDGKQAEGQEQEEEQGAARSALEPPKEPEADDGDERVRRKRGDRATEGRTSGGRQRNVKEPVKGRKGGVRDRKRGSAR